MKRRKIDMTKVRATLIQNDSAWDVDSRDDDTVAETINIHLFIAKK